jgi:hypothetical protein
MSKKINTEKITDLVYGQILPFLATIFFVLGLIAEVKYIFGL